MTVYFILCVGLTVFYAVIMTIYQHFWENTPENILKGNTIFPKVSVIIPVRNESANITQLIEDLIGQDYLSEKIEIVVVDDFSEDDTVKIVTDFHDERIKIIELKNLLNPEDISTAYKKRALEIGIRQSSGEIIMTTDGDCRVSNRWISTMVGILQSSGNKLLTGAVLMDNTPTRFRKFQSLDFLGMMGITAAMLKMKIYNMANGANLIYEKKAFLEVDGFKGIDHLASGDDMLLMYKMAKKYQGAVGYAKHPDAVVYTETLSDIPSFLQQRFRWTAKSKDYQDKRMTWILGTVFLFVFTVFLNFLLAPFFKCIVGLLLVQLIVKCIVDYRLLNSTSRYYSRNELMQTFFSSQIFHILYIVLVGSLGNILQFEWKGRKVNK